MTQSKNELERLKRLLAEHYKEHDRYPSVRISKDFWENHASAIAKLADKGINIQVDENIVLENTFLLDDLETKGQTVDTLHDLKKVVDQLVAEGKGDWPVRNMPPDTNSFHKITLYTVIRGEEPFEGFAYYPNVWSEPLNEYIRLEIGQ
jgi:hypothetical protein